MSFEKCFQTSFFDFEKRMSLIACVYYNTGWPKQNKFPPLQNMAL